MKTPTQLLVTPYLAPVARECQPTGQLPMRYRWRAELLQKGRTVLVMVGFETPDAAIGSLFRVLAHTCRTVDEVVDLIASAFGDLGTHSANVQVGRAIRIAARHPYRRNPGWEVLIGDPVPATEPHATPLAFPARPEGTDATPAPVPEPAVRRLAQAAKAAVRKGGAA